MIIVGREWLQEMENEQDVNNITRENTACLPATTLPSGNCDRAPCGSKTVVGKHVTKCRERGTDIGDVAGHGNTSRRGE
jgi:hypothetical protein